MQVAADPDDRDVFIIGWVGDSINRRKGLFDTAESLPLSRRHRPLTSGSLPPRAIVPSEGRELRGRASLPACPESTSVSRETLPEFAALLTRTSSTWFFSIDPGVSRRRHGSGCWSRVFTLADAFPYSRRLQQAFGSSPRIGAAPLLGCSSYPEGRRRLIKGVGPDQGPKYNRMMAREGRFQ